MDEEDIDVGGGCRRIERFQVDLPCGHCVKDNVLIPLKSTRQVETFYIERTFDFNCPKMPTSWCFRVTFTRELNKITRCVTSIRRTDEGSTSVYVKFMVRTHMEHRGPNAYAKHVVFSMASGTDEKKVFGNFEKELDSEELSGREVPFEVFLNVRACHGVNEFGEMPMAKKADSSADSEDLLASKQILFLSS